MTKLNNSRRLATIPGVGLITATALVATIGDASQFRSGRELAAWLGLVPKQYSTGGKDRRSGWLQALLARRPTNVVLVAMANKTARTAWALLTRHETYRAVPIKA